MDSLFLQKNSRLGRQAAQVLLRRSALSGYAYRWFGRAEAAAFLFMKKPTRRDHPSEASRRSPQACHKKSGSTGSWAFNLASESLFALGSTERARRVAYRGADGELRFLPL